MPHAVVLGMEPMASHRPTSALWVGCMQAPCSPPEYWVWGSLVANKVGLLDCDFKWGTLGVVMIPRVIHSQWVHLGAFLYCQDWGRKLRPCFGDREGQVRGILGGWIW